MGLVTIGGRMVTQEMIPGDMVTREEIITGHMVTQEEIVTDRMITQEEIVTCRMITQDGIWIMEWGHKVTMMLTCAWLMAAAAMKDASRFTMTVSGGRCVRTAGMSATPRWCAGVWGWA